MHIVLMHKFRNIAFVKSSSVNLFYRVNLGPPACLITSTVLTLLFILIPFLNSIPGLNHIFVKLRLPFHWTSKKMMILQMYRPLYLYICLVISRSNKIVDGFNPIYNTFLCMFLINLNREILKITGLLM